MRPSRDHRPSVRTRLCHVTSHKPGYRDRAEQVTAAGDLLTGDSAEQATTAGDLTSKKDCAEQLSAGNQGLRDPFIHELTREKREHCGWELATQAWWDRSSFLKTLELISGVIPDSHQYSERPQTFKLSLKENVQALPWNLMFPWKLGVSVHSWGISENYQVRLTELPESRGNPCVPMCTWACRRSLNSCLQTVHRTRPYRISKNTGVSALSKKATMVKEREMWYNRLAVTLPLTSRARKKRDWKSQIFYLPSYCF